MWGAVGCGAPSARAPELGFLTPLQLPWLGHSHWVCSPFPMALGRVTSMCSQPGTISLLSLMPHPTLSSAQVAFRKMLEKEAKGVEPDIAVPKFKQRKWESDRAYIQRMEQETQHVLFLSKNQAARQPEVQVAPKKEKSERKKA